MISSLLFLISSLPFLSASLSSPHVISLPLTRHTYDRMPHPHDIHTMAVGTPVATQGCAINNFYTPVQIGFNQYKLTVDTIMATTAVADATCTNCKGVTPLYVPGPTAALQTGTVQQSYGDGRGWNGILYTDNVVLPATTLPSVNLAFAGITSQVGPFFPTARCDGLNLTSNNNQGTLGLGQPTSILSGTASYFNSLIAATTPPIDAIMAIQMCAVGGRLWLGGYDNNFMIGLPSFTTMLPNLNTYSATISNLLLGGVSTNIPTASFGTVVIDSTTTNMLFPPSVYNTIVSALTSNPDFIAAFGATFFSDGKCIAPKSGSAIDALNLKLPHLQIQMGTQVQLDMQPISSYVREFITLTNTNTVGITDTKLYCPGISMSTNAAKTTLGWTFLNQWTTIFDRLNQRIGFAPTSNCGGFVGADAVFTQGVIPATTTTTPFTQTPAFIGIIIVVVVVFLIIVGVGIYYGSRFFTGKAYNNKLKSLNYTTSSPNAKVQFADPVVGSKGFLSAGPTQPTTRNTPHSVEQDGIYTDSPLASSPLSSSASENGFSPMNEPVNGRNNFQQQQRPNRAMVAQRGMMNNPPIQQTTVQPSNNWSSSQTNSWQGTPNESPRDWPQQPAPQPQRPSPRQENMQSWGNQSQVSQASWGNQSQQSWSNQSQQQQSWGQARNPAQLNNNQQAPPRKYNGGGGGRGGQSEWVEHYDEQDGSPYYYNTRTQETTWERPASFGNRY